MVYCHSMNAGWVDTMRWWGHSSPTCCNQINLKIKCLLSELVEMLKYFPRITSRKSHLSQHNFFSTEISWILLYCRSRSNYFSKSILIFKDLYFSEWAEVCKNPYFPNELDQQGLIFCKWSQVCKDPYFLNLELQTTTHVVTFRWPPRVQWFIIIFFFDYLLNRRDFRTQHKQNRSVTMVTAHLTLMPCSLCYPKGLTDPSPYSVALQWMLMAYQQYGPNFCNFNYMAVFRNFGKISSKETKKEKKSHHKGCSIL